MGLIIHHIPEGEIYIAEINFKVHFEGCIGSTRKEGAGSKPQYSSWRLNVESERGKGDSWWLDWELLADDGSIPTQPSDTTLRHN